MLGVFWLRFVWHANKVFRINILHLWERTVRFCGDGSLGFFGIISSTAALRAYIQLQTWQLRVKVDSTQAYICYNNLKGYTFKL